MERNKSDVYRVTNCPIPTGLGKHHDGLDSLLGLMGNHGLKLYRMEEDTDIGGKDGFIYRSDVVLEGTKK